jgi:uncharacterized protein DUF3617
MKHLSVVLVCGLLLTGAVGDATSETPPRRKSGLWEIKTTVSNSPREFTGQICVDQNSDDLWTDGVKSGDQMTCSKNTVRKEGSDWVSESVCQVESSTATTRAVFTGNFESNYRVESKSSYVPPLMGIKEGTTVIDAKWLGPCEPGQTLGDVVVPEIERMKQMMQGAGGNP